MAFGFLFTLPLIATVMIAFILGYSASKSVLPIKWPFLLTLAGTITSTVAFSLEMSSGNLADKVLWNNVEYVYGVFAAPLYLALILQYVGMDKWMSLRRAVLLSTIPFLTLVLLWTNDVHHLVYSSVTLANWGDTPMMSVSYGPWFWLHFVYAVILITTAVALCLKSLGTTSNAQRYQVFGVVLSGIIPTGAVLLGLTHIFPIPTTYAMIIGLMITSIIIFICTFRLEFFAVNPLAFDTMIANIQDSTVVLDVKGRIVFVNPPARKLMGDHQKGLGRPLAESFPFLQEVSSKLEEGKAQQMVQRIGTEKRYFDVRSSTIRNSSGTMTGRLLVIRDVTEEKRTSEALSTANSKLMLLSSITRHDILNQLSVIRGYGNLIEMGVVNGPDIGRYVSSMVSSAATIEKQVLFTREYQDMGVKEPEWQNLELVLARAKSIGPAAPSEVNVQVGRVEVYADRMLEKVFHNLFHNSAKHGQKVQRISITSEPCGTGLNILYEDDGVGISPERKECIFQEGSVNSRIGLFMSKQILAITDISISEKGQVGSGVRFVLTIPTGGWRNR